MLWDRPSATGREIYDVLLATGRLRRRIAYTIVEGEALPWPEDATKTTRDGVEFRTFEDGDRSVVTWRRDGRTCVLSATNVPTDELLTLASWKGKGAVAF